MLPNLPSCFAMQAKTEDGVDLRVRRRLRELRIQHGLTLEDVAGRSNIDVSTLSRLESGKRRLALDHLPRLAAALSISTDELLRAPEAEDPRVTHLPRGDLLAVDAAGACGRAARLQDSCQRQARHTAGRATGARGSRLDVCAVRSDAADAW